MKEYITISKEEKDMVVLAIFVLISFLVILCFKGMQISKQYIELKQEKEALEEIVEVQKGVINETRQQ